MQSKLTESQQTRLLNCFNSAVQIVAALPNAKRGQAIDYISAAIRKAGEPRQKRKGKHA